MEKITKVSRFFSARDVRKIFEHFSTIQFVRERYYNRPKYINLGLLRISIISFHSKKKRKYLLNRA